MPLLQVLYGLVVSKACLELVDLFSGSVSAREAVVGVAVKELHLLAESESGPCLELDSGHVDDEDALEAEVLDLV